MATALEAGKIIMRHFRGDSISETKSDSSPVTDADREAEQVICAALEEEFPQIPIVAEERVESGIIPRIVERLYFLVDPLDGTKEFIERRSDFTVNIALICDGEPIAGVVLAPAHEKLYYGSRSGAISICDVKEPGDAGQSKWKPIRAVNSAEGLIAVASRSHRSVLTDQFLELNQVTNFREAGSSLKFCLVAEGAAHVYPRFGRTMQWDTAAGDAILRAAGGMVVSFNEQPLRYYANEERNFENEHFIAAAVGVGIRNGRIFRTI